MCGASIGMAVRVEAGPGVYKGQEVDDVLCDASMHKEAKGLLFLEKSRFHRVDLCMSAHFIIRLLAALFRKAMS